jgi:hypothetical protein
MGTGKRRINSAVRVLLIVLVAELEHAQVAAEPGHVPVVAEPEHDPVAAERVHDPVAAELEHVPVVAELAHAQVVAELEHVPVVAELAHDQAVAERVHVPVEVVPELDPLRAQLAGVLKTKSVTGVPRRDLVLSVAVALAAAAEITRVPAAAEAVIAWEVAE